MRPLLFLDIDGVLISRPSLRKRSGLMSEPDPACMNALNAILRETKAQIVITSTWRKWVDYEEIECFLEHHDMWPHGGRLEDPTIIGQTPLLLGDRPREIMQWLVANDCIMRPSIIIDDDLVSLPNITQIKTDTETGLTMDDAFHAIQVLKEQAAQ